MCHLPDTGASDVTAVPCSPAHPSFRLGLTAPPQSFGGAAMTSLPRMRTGVDKFGKSIHGFAAFSAPARRCLRRMRRRQWCPFSGKYLLNHIGLGDIAWTYR